MVQCHAANSKLYSTFVSIVNHILTACFRKYIHTYIHTHTHTHTHARIHTHSHVYLFDDLLHLSSHEYLNAMNCHSIWDHRNASLREWLVNSHVMGPLGMGNPNVSGFYFDDVRFMNPMIMPRLLFCFRLLFVVVVVIINIVVVIFFVTLLQLLSVLLMWMIIVSHQSTCTSMSSQYWINSGEGWSNGPSGLPVRTAKDVNLSDCKTGPSEIQIDW